MSILTLADLSDYLAPSQICIKPVTMVEDTSEDPIIKTKDHSIASTEIIMEEEQGVYEIKRDPLTGKKLKKAEITLNDCLACSGCITSAESILVSLQSHEEVYRVLSEQPELTPILSFAPQSIASLAALHDLSLEETMKGLRIFFKQTFNFRLVFDTTFARSLSLAENRLEFLERKQQSIAPISGSDIPGPLPIISSACPGWICYAEKTHGELLPFVSNVKSSQAIMGTLVKSGKIAQSLGLRQEQIYHVTVMPCYDKKLEASRPDFTNEITSTDSTTPLAIREVDCVLTTGEVQRMLDDKNISLSDLAQSTNSEMGLEESTFYPDFVPGQGTSSGGYLFNTIQATLGALSLPQLYETKLIEKKVRSEDYVEFTLVASNIASTSSLTDIPNTSTLLRVAKCYGFKNLQNVVRKISRDAGVSVTRGAAGVSPMSAAAKRNAALMKRKGTSDGGEKFDYVEVMACPSGCVNGGGQIAPPKHSVRKLKSKMDEEGMPILELNMETDLEIKMVVDLNSEERILSGKDWVSRVEQVYWSSTKIMIQKPIKLDWSKVDSSLLPYLLDGETQQIRDLMESSLRELESVGKTRKEVLRTNYRAVEDVEVNGLAVKW